jgi:diaminopimelate decarboxylase
MVHHFTHRDDTLYAEDVNLNELAAKVGTPFYVYSSATLRRHVRVVKAAFEGIPTLLAYAMKANSNQAVLKLMASEGAGADVVSLGELERALAAGIRPELERLSMIAADMGLTAKVSVRINPDVDARTHAKISTGKAENKFGIPYERARTVYERIAELPNVTAVGVDMHIGSQITELEPFSEAFGLMAELVTALKADGHAITHVDVGGGLGIPYSEGEIAPPPVEYAAVVRDKVGKLGVTLVIEPGRLLVGNAGILVTKVEYVKEGGTNFVIVDAAMNDLIRPTLYEAHHDIVPVNHSNLAPITADIVGPVCETGDYLAKARTMPGVKEGDLLAVMSAGAYGAVMASTYNSRMLIPEVLVDGDKFHVIRPRKSIAELIALDSVPDWV